MAVGQLSQIPPRQKGAHRQQLVEGPVKLEQCSTVKALPLYPFPFFALVWPWEKYCTQET